TPGDESKVIELADGTWMVNSRGNGAGHRYVHLSADEGKTWGEGSTVHAGNSAYSSMTFIPGKGIGLLYERNDYREIVFTRINP
ncbi:MAG: sialidase family protein, partial [Bacteroidales bacterium]